MGRDSWLTSFKYDISILVGNSVIVVYVGVGSILVLVTIYGFDSELVSQVFQKFYTGILKYLLLGIGYGISMASWAIQLMRPQKVLVNMLVFLAKTCQGLCWLYIIMYTCILWPEVMTSEV